MDAEDKHHSLWNSFQERIYLEVSRLKFPDRYKDISQSLIETERMTNQNFIQEFKADYPEADDWIMEVTPVWMKAADLMEAGDSDKSLTL